jgi:hypothetical protein
MRSSMSLADEIRAYLEERPEGATSAELARRFLAATHLSERLAEELIRAALQGAEWAELGTDGQWRLVQLAPDLLGDRTFLCLSARQTVDATGLELGWTVLQNGKVSGTGLCFSRCGAPGALYPAEWRDLPQPDVVVFRRRSRGLGPALQLVRKAWGRELALWEASAVARALFPFRRFSRPESLAAQVGEDWLADADPRTESLALSAIWLRLVELLEELEVRTSAALESFTRLVPPDFRRFAFGPEKLRRLPSSPGVYLMKDADGQVAYVGKAKNLAARVPNYFRPLQLLSERDRNILDAISDFEVIPLGSELEALLVEYRLIQLHRPRLNRQTDVQLRDHWRRVRGDYAIVLPSVQPGHAEVFLLNRYGRLCQVRCGADLSEGDRLAQAVRSLFFEPEPVGDKEGEIAFSWLASREPWENVLWASRWSSWEEGVREIAARVREIAGSAPPSSRAR